MLESEWVLKSCSIGIDENGNEWYIQKLITETKILSPLYFFTIGFNLVRESFCRFTQKNRNSKELMGPLKALLRKLWWIEFK